MIDSTGVAGRSEQGIGNLNYKNLNDIIDDNDVLIDDHENFGGLDFPRLNNFDADKFEYYTIDKYNTLCSTLPNTNKALKIIHLNIRGLEKNFDNLLLYLNSLDNTFDIICLSETHILDINYAKNRYILEGYDTFYVSSYIKYGGCAIYAKTSLNVTQIKPLTKSTSTCDYIFIKLPKYKNNKPLVVGAYYRHCLQNKSDVMNFLNDFENSLDCKSIKKHKTVITGDFNLDLCQVNRSNDIKAYFNCLLSNGLECHILKPTRIQYYPNSL